MKTITFRPLRRIKKTGKITVASYAQWRKVKTADYNKFRLIVDNEYKTMPKGEYVYNHEGEQLFFYAYNPNDIPIFNWSPVWDLETIRQNHISYGINWGGGNCINFHADGLDCDGVPTLSHYSADSIAEHYKNMNDFEPLTVQMVVKWFGWFLLQLDNSYLQIGK